MKVVIAAATSNAALRTYLAANRANIVPPDVLENGYWHDKGTRFSVRIKEIDQLTTGADLGVWLRRVATATDGLILLIDEQSRHLAADFEDAYFVVGLAAYPGRVMQNQVRATMAPVLRHFASYCQRVDSLANQRILLLPLDIFLAADLAVLRDRMTLRKMEPGLGGDLDSLIGALARRSRPRKHKRFRKVYLVDDRPLWYRYGPERHRIVETTMPPHADKCWHNSLFRFGRLYDDRLHHNVDDGSVPTQVYGNFVTCHGAPFAASGQSHLNVFPNGYL